MELVENILLPVLGWAMFVVVRKFIPVSKLVSVRLAVSTGVIFTLITLLPVALAFDEPRAQIRTNLIGFLLLLCGYAGMSSSVANFALASRHAHRQGRD